MQAAASVSYPVARSRRGGAWLGAVWLAGALPVVGWCCAVPAAGAWRLAMLLCTVGIGLHAGRWWWRTCGGLLRWDGQDWSLDALPGRVSRRPPAPGTRLTVALDLQNLLLLRLDTPGRRRPRWVLADRAAAPALWHGLRCAVTASATRVPSDGPEAVGR